MPAEYSRMFLVDNLAEEKGFMDSPTAEYNRNLFIILQGEGNRQWLECLYVDRELKPLGHISTIIPCVPNDENSLLDACIAFAPKFFESCESIKEVKSNLDNSELLEAKRPKGWEKIREEARPIFERKIRIMEYPIPGKLLDFGGKYNKSNTSN